MMMQLRNIIVTLFVSLNVFAQTSSNSLFFNQPLPDVSAAVFAPGVVSDELGNRDMAIAPDGSEFFYTIQYRGGLFSAIVHVQKIKGKWSKPEVATFSGNFNDLEPAFSPDGSTLYFSSNRPSAGKTVKDYDVWFVTKQNGKWVNPQQMATPVNTNEDEFYVSVAKSGNLYFTRKMKDKGEDIVVCRWLNGKYEEAISLPDAINTPGDEFNAFVDPSEQYIIYTGYKRKGATGAGDLYISKKNEKGEWETSQNLGTKINGPGLTYCPYVSADKKYFFFAASRNNAVKPPFEKKQTLSSFKMLAENHLNGWDNIYWIKAELILQ